MRGPVAREQKAAKNHPDLTGDSHRPSPRCSRQTRLKAGSEKTSRFSRCCGRQACTTPGRGGGGGELLRGEGVFSVSPVRGGHPRASGTEAALQGAHTSSFPPATCLGPPPPPQHRGRGPSENRQRQSREVPGPGGWTTLLSVCRKLPLGTPGASPAGPTGRSLSCFPELPAWKPGGGVRPHGGWVGEHPAGARRHGVRALGGGGYSPMHVRPSEWRAYFWWQPHVGPVSVSSQLCWQPPFP